MLERERPDELVLAEADFDEETVLGVVELAHRVGVKVKLAPTTTELLVHEGEYVPGEGLPLFELRPPMFTGLEWATKRTFDLVVALVFVLVGTPLWLLIAAAIKLDSRGPVLYVDRRVGRRASAISACSSSGRWSRTRQSSSRSSRTRTRPRARCSRSATTRA